MNNFFDIKSRIVNKFGEIVLGKNRYLDFLIHQLKKNFELKFLREWTYNSNPPHFYDQRHNIVDLGFGTAAAGAFPLYRAFYTSEVIAQGDKVLDIGCGDGFFTLRFYSIKASMVDAVDIEPSAIEHCLKYNASPKINYKQIDAIKDPFPNPSYDVIVFDGGIGHISREDTLHLLKKIKSHLTDTGIFSGSESLGREGHDHLQFFESLDDLRALFSPHFKYISLKSIEYKIGSGFLRNEAYWRCSNSLSKMKKYSWSNNF
jgi:SAM-dependent methyltransferase